MDLLLIRHALPRRVADPNREGPADPGLDPRGVRQAGRLADYLAAEGDLDALYCSPLRRARETAEPLAAALGLEIVVLSGLAEMDQHSNVYIPMEELRRDPAWRSRMDSTSPEQERERAEFRQRVVETLEGLIQDNPGRKVVAVCHGGVIYTYLEHILGITRREWFEPGYASVNRVLASRRGHRNIGTLNETFHLRDAP